MKKIQGDLQEMVLGLLERGEIQVTSIEVPSGLGWGSIKFNIPDRSDPPACEEFEFEFEHYPYTVSKATNSPGELLEAALVYLILIESDRIQIAAQTGDKFYDGEEILGFLNYMPDWPYNDGRSVILSETLLKENGADILRKAGMSARQFRNWCKDNGRFFIEDRWKNIKINGLNHRWWLFKLSPEFYLP